MNFDWQTAIVLVVVAACAGYVARLMWQAVAAKRAGCGSCDSCPAGTNAADPQVFELAGRDRPKKNAAG
jgi:hypothetical protein